MKNITFLIEKRHDRHFLTLIEKKTFIQHIFNLNSRKFASQINDVKNMTNFFLRRVMQSVLIFDE